MQDPETGVVLHETQPAHAIYAKRLVYLACQCPLQQP